MDTQSNQNQANLLTQVTTQNPIVVLLLLILLGGQGAGLFVNASSTVDLRALRDDVQRALYEITDNRTRIARNEARINDLQSVITAQGGTIDRLQREAISLSARIAECEAR